MLLAGLHFAFFSVMEPVESACGSSFHVFSVYRTGRPRQRFFISHFPHLLNRWTMPAVLRFAFSPFIEPMHHASSSSFRIFSFYRTARQEADIKKSCYMCSQDIYGAW